MHISRQPEYHWQAREVVREVDHRPQLLVRLTVSGGLFRHRALDPFMRIVHDDTVVADSWFTEISADSRELMGYFRGPLPPEGIIEFGYLDEPPGRAPMRFDARHIARLDRERLDQDVVLNHPIAPDR